MADTTETILLQVDIVANNVRLQELAKDVRLAKEEFANLQAAVKAGTAEASLLDAGAVRLKATLAAASQETRVLTQANTAQVKATQASTGSIEQLRAQLALGTAEYNKLSAAERDSTDAGQKLQAGNKQLSDNLKVLEGAIGDTRRNVGNYAGAIDPLIAQLVKLQEQQKLAAPDSAAYQEAGKQIGFVAKAAQDAGAKMGLSAEQTAAKLKTVGEAVRPATAELVKLEAEQAKVEKGTTAYTQIGFKINQATKEIAKAPAELKQVEAATEGVKTGFSSALSKGLAPFHNELDRGTGLLGKFKSGSDLVKEGLGLLKGAGETGSLGFKAIAGGIALTGIGLFVIAISAVVAYFTQTAEGGKQLATVLGYLSGVLQVATDLVTGLGKNLIYAFTQPLESIKTFAKTVAEAITHPIEFARKLAEGFVNITNRANEAGKASSQFSARTRELLIARRELDKQDAIEESRVAVLLRLSKERGKTATDQLSALESAGKIEREITEGNISLKTKELKLIDDKIKAAGAGSTAELKADKFAKELEIIQAATAQNEVNAKIQVRESVFREKLRTEAATAAQKAREDAVKAKQTEAERLLLTTQAGSAAELAVKQRLVQLAADLEIAGAKKTAAEKALIQAKANVEIEKLAEDFNQKQLENAKKATEATIKEREREYAEAKKNLDDYLDGKRAAIEQDYAEGKISEFLYQKQLGEINRAGLAAALVDAQQYKQQTGAIEKKQGEEEIKRSSLITNEKKRLKGIENDIIRAGYEAAMTASDVVIEAFGKESAAGKAALIVKKTLAIAEIAIGVEKQLIANGIAGAKISAEFPPVSTPLGIAYTIATDALAIATGAASISKVLGFNAGGLVPGAGNTDSVPALLTPGEVVMNKTASQQYAPVLSYLNTISGGANFAPGFNPQGARASDGGLAARSAGGAMGIDYQQLAHAMAQQPVSVDVRAIAVQQGRVARARALTTLGSRHAALSAPVGYRVNSCRMSPRP